MRNFLPTSHVTFDATLTIAAVSLGAFLRLRRLPRLRDIQYDQSINQSNNQSTNQSINHIIRKKNVIQNLNATMLVGEVGQADAVKRISAFYMTEQHF